MTVFTLIILHLVYSDASPIESNGDIISVINIIVQRVETLESRMDQMTAEFGNGMKNMESRIVSGVQKDISKQVATMGSKIKQERNAAIAGVMNRARKGLRHVLSF